MPLASLCLLFLASRDAIPVRLARTFTPNEKLAYALTSHITAEQRQQGLQTFIPEDFDINYGFETIVTALKADGIAVLTYRRPSITEIEGETAKHPPKAKTTLSKDVYELTVSPVNELLELKDVSPKKAAPKKKGNARMALASAPPIQGIPFANFIGEMHRLALFAGSVDSGLDFAPKLPLEPVKIGDTWKRTVGYQPQKLSGKDGKSATQRLDYTYTYLGNGKTQSGKPVLRIQAKLNLDTDLGDFLRTQYEEVSKDNPQLKQALANIKMPLKLAATIDFDLDPKTKMTLGAYAKSEGGFTFSVRAEGDAVLEENFKGRTTLELVGRKIVLPVKRKL